MAEAPNTNNMVCDMPPNRNNTLNSTPLVNAGAQWQKWGEKTSKTYGNMQKHAQNTPELATKRPQRESKVRGQRSEISKSTLQYAWIWLGRLLRGYSRASSVPRTSPALHIKHSVQNGVRRPVGGKESPKQCRLLVTEGDIIPPSINRRNR